MYLNELEAPRSQGSVSTLGRASWEVLVSVSLGPVAASLLSLSAIPA